MGGDVRHVLMTADAVGGVWTYALELAGALARHQIRTTLATMGPLPTADQLSRARSIPDLTVVTSAFDLEWMDEPWDAVEAAGDWLLDLETRVDPDIVHLNGYAHAALPFKSPVLVAGHSCVLSWAEAVPGRIDQRTLDAYRTRVTEGIRRACHVVAPSAAMLAALQRHYGSLPCTSVIPNGRGGVFSPARKEPFAFTAGRLWDRAKNIEALGAVAAGLPWPVFAAGEGEASLGQGLHALGRLTEADVAAWLSRASICALPARYEPFGLLPLEAALSGCALLLGDIPSLREVWGDAAEYVHPDDRAGLRRALTRMMTSPDIQLRGRAARKHAGRYSETRMGDAYRSLYAGIRSGAHLRSGAACAS
jgi:glycogen(starch) synthase